MSKIWNFAKYWIAWLCRLKNLNASCKIGQTLRFTIFVITLGLLKRIPGVNVATVIKSTLLAQILPSCHRYPVITVTDLYHLWLFYVSTASISEIHRVSNAIISMLLELESQMSDQLSRYSQKQLSCYFPILADWASSEVISDFSWIL